MAAHRVWDLTGRADGPSLQPPEGIADRVADLGRPIGVDVVALLGERAELTGGIQRRGAATCGGAGRLLRARDVWVAVTLAREDDRRSVPAWLEEPLGDPDPWAVVEAQVPHRAATDLVERATLLGLPVASLGEVAPPQEPVRSTYVGEDGRTPSHPLVVDLSSLWAGPLCTRLLADAGAEVVKVEAPTRPDGARQGSPAFFERLHAGKTFQTLPLDSPELADLLWSADVVVEGSRARALGQHGIDPESVAPPVWVTITGYGRDVDRVAFGDDAAVAGGLVAWDDRGPCFAGDAIADPLTGVAAAVAALQALEAGGRWVIDAAMAGVAAHVAGPDAGHPWTPVR